MNVEKRERERQRKIDRQKSNTAYGPDAGDDPRGLGSGMLMFPAIDCRKVL
jgi:hypothetical protein